MQHSLKTNLTIPIALAGFGTVGQGVWQILHQHSSLLKQRLGAQLEVRKVAVRSKKKARSQKIPAQKLTTDLNELIADPKIQIIVELMGDVKASRKLAMAAMKAGKHFVSANKALVALHGPELFAFAKTQQVDFCFEAAVGGGIPILRALREGMVGNEIQSLYGILNGTCNYILTQMSEQGSDFSKTLKMAQKLGYAEADPSFDVDGIDAAHKLAILVAIAYGVKVDFKQLYVEGIRKISPTDLDFAKRFGLSIKLLAVAKKVKGGVQARVHPTMISQDHMLAAVKGVYNAVFLEGDFVGPSMLYGKGAGSEPTASAVVGDLVEVARNIQAGVGYTVPPLGTHLSPIQSVKLQPITALSTPYYLRFQAIDRPGVLAKIAKILGAHHIGISSVYQPMRQQEQEVPILILTHEALEKNVQKAVDKIEKLTETKRSVTVIRMEKDLS